MHCSRLLDFTELNVSVTQNNNSLLWNSDAGSDCQPPEHVQKLIKILLLKEMSVMVTREEKGSRRQSSFYPLCLLNTGPVNAVDEDVSL